MKLTDSVLLEQSAQVIVDVYARGHEQVFVQANVDFAHQALGIARLAALCQSGHDLLVALVPVVDVLLDARRSVLDHGSMARVDDVRLDVENALERVHVVVEVFELG